MKTEWYRSKRKFPGKAIKMGVLNSGYWFVEGLDVPTEQNKFNSIEEIEKLFDDEFELIVPLQ